MAGKLIRRPLQTKLLGVARLCLGDLEKQERTRTEAETALEAGDAKLSAVSQKWAETQAADHSVKETAKLCYRQRLAALLKSWPGLENMKVRKISDNDCQQWAARYRKLATGVD